MGLWRKSWFVGEIRELEIGGSRVQGEEG
ncbi:hypothetical protein NC652_034120 [Populus alba x Populus x berolinensis]|uniref:Uncharacterized protein n=1 Tax=Populus alba x Populus x berolinensis TaxID=444605 RepID=A0AAD6LY21_9ROSI|nr:hypothetical protein NC652_034120 [Populus alba x Populus x berolinensis]KAJ6973877.1 hypothetical protein NC653_034028 [Populus alba x Populus x berolinensis]